MYFSYDRFFKGFLMTDATHILFFVNICIYICIYLYIRHLYLDGAMT